MKCNVKEFYVYDRDNYIELCFELLDDTAFSMALTMKQFEKLQMKVGCPSSQQMTKMAIEYDLDEGEVYDGYKTTNPWE